MLTELEIKKLLDEVEKDERLWYKTANIQINAPLALIQLQLETQSALLRKILGIEILNFTKLRNDK